MQPKYPVLLPLLIIFLFQWHNIVAQNRLKVINQERLSFDKGWKFHPGDIPFPEIKTHEDSYNSAKAGNARGAASPEYNDKEWRVLRLPHDWVVEGRYDSTENIGQSYRKRGYGWYRRHFKLDTADRGKYLEVQFDGVATHATVWVNGTVVHRSWSGSSSFYIDITALAKYGEHLNTIVVRVDADAMEGWWYEGAGIYRHVWLVKRNPVHITTDGVFANPVKKDGDNWVVPVEVTIQNTGQDSASVEVETIIQDKNGKAVARKTTEQTVAPLEKSEIGLVIAVSRPQLWRIEDPALYKVIVRVKLDGFTTDTLLTKCGFRTIRFDKDSGFYLNDRPLKIKGVCNHQDHAGVGVAIPDALWEFRIRKLKEMGVNGYRCAHNPPAAELLDVCDSLGMMVMDENRNFNSSPEYVAQLEWLVKRDRNHPCVILWSVFNEEPMQGTASGYEMVRRMRHIVKKLDTTRPVTAAMNGGLFAPVNVSQAVDVVGFNYQDDAYDRFHRENPDMKLTSSEDISAYQVRGVYKTDKDKNLIDAYDSESTPWGKTHREGWKLINERPFLAGGFIWTGFDYHGEPTPFKWPSVSSFFGAMDLCGFPKMAYYLHQAQWVNDKAILQVVPHWTYPPDSLGKPIKIMALSNADSLTLTLNGKLISGQKADLDQMNTWTVPYKPGRLVAVSFKRGKEVARKIAETTGKPVKLGLIPDREKFKGDGFDAMPVTVLVTDGKGRAVPTASLPVKFTISDNAEIIGLGNGDPNSHEPEKGDLRSLFNGLAQVIIRSKENTSGKVVLMASSPGIKPARMAIRIDAVKPIPAVDVVAPVIMLDKWLVSPVFYSTPNPNQNISDNDMNSWSPVRPGSMTRLALKKSYSLYRTKFYQNSPENAKGFLRLKRIRGIAEIWLDGIRIGSKQDKDSRDLNVPFQGGAGKRQLTVMIIAEAGEEAGIDGVVTYETE